MADAKPNTAVKENALASAMAEPLHAPASPMRKVFYVALVIVLLVFPHVFESSKPFWVHVMITTFMFALMAQSWNILAGFCGQISLGHAAFFGIGAYSTGFLFFAYQISPWIGMLIGVLIAMGVAVAIGIPTFRLRGHYFAIATLLIGVGIQIFVQRWELVGAASGIFLPIVRETPFLSFQFHGTKLPYYYIILSFLVLACFVVWRLDRSRIGFYFRAIRDEPEAASSLGVNVTLYKSYAFMISAALMSMAGAFYCQNVLVIDPESVFPLSMSILVVLMAVMGGAGTLWGPIIGAAVLVPLSEFTRVKFGGTGGTLDLMIYGALIVLICIFKPEGLVGAVKMHHDAESEEKVEDGDARG
jgi:branched-chain amino acid transport system permease protein